MRSSHRAVIPKTRRNWSAALEMLLPDLIAGRIRGPATQIWLRLQLNRCLGGGYNPT
jgi:hypothetical protein